MKTLNTMNAIILLVTGLSVGWGTSPVLAQDADDDIKVHIHIIGFEVDADAEQQLREMAAAAVGPRRRPTGGAAPSPAIAAGSFRATTAKRSSRKKASG